MKAKITKEDVFTLEVAGLKFPGMRVKSHWLGLTELRNEKDEMLIVSGMDDAWPSDTFASIFGGIFRTAAETQEAGVMVVMGTPALMAQIQAAGAKE